MKGPAPRGAGFFVPASHLATMSQLHMTRVAVGCADYPALQMRIANYGHNGEIRFATRFKPKRADELIGGKLHFIVKHRLVGRSEEHTSELQSLMRKSHAAFCLKKKKNNHPNGTLSMLCIENHHP